MDEKDQHTELTWAAPVIHLNEPEKVPDHIGPYKIENLLVQGGMSLIYLGVHPKSGEKVIVKVIQPKYLKNNDVVSRLLKEAKVLRSVHHTGIVKLYDLGKWDHGIYVAMELVVGVSLREFIKKNSLTHRKALEIALQIGAALQHLHEAGVIHRDLKPDNILVTNSGDVKLIDFGISEFLEVGKKREETFIAGTPGYMSPEQKEHPEEVSYESDIYSLGLITYELYTGKLSYGIVYPALLPRHLRRVVEKALQFSVEHRYHKVSDFLKDIHHFLEHFEKEIKEKEESFGLAEMALVKEVLIPKSAGNWTEAEIGVAWRDGNLWNLPYLDFFHLPGGHLGIVLAEEVEEAKLPLAPILMFRGMVRAVVDDLKPFDPVKMIEKLNQLLLKENIRFPVAFSFLLLQPDADRLWFIACGKGSLLEWVEDGFEPNLFDNPAPPLGNTQDLSILKGEENWPIGSTLLFSLTHLDPKHLPSNMMLAPEHLAKEVIEKQPDYHKDNAKTIPLVVIRRI